MTSTLYYKSEALPPSQAREQVWPRHTSPLRILVVSSALLLKILQAVFDPQKEDRIFYLGKTAYSISVY
jgi:hypothetical protein